MEGWKEEIANRLREKREYEQKFEIIINHVEKTLDSLLSELKEDYQIKVKLTTKVGDKSGYVWIVTIENQSVELFPSTIRQYHSENNDLKDTLISIILDKFTFNN